MDEQGRVADSDLRTRIILNEIDGRAFQLGVVAFVDTARVASATAGTSAGLVSTRACRSRGDADAARTVSAAAMASSGEESTYTPRMIDAHATTVDIGPELTALARVRLARHGYHPQVVTGDGAEGVPERLAVYAAGTSDPVGDLLPGDL